MPTRIIHLNGEEVEVGYGWKFLTPWGTTESDEHGSFAYTLPARGQKWSEPTVHPAPVAPDGSDCGPGRLHVMNVLDARYASPNWWPWFVRYATKSVIGRSDEKTSVETLQLRRVSLAVFARFIRWHGATGANLTRADLTGADLSGANLRGAYLSGAYLTGANLTDADLTRADLRYADLTHADLTYADLTGANLTHANLTGANLTGANLTDALNLDLAIGLASPPAAASALEGKVE